MNVEDIERFIDRWRATLTPATVDGFMRRHHGGVPVLVQRILARRGQPEKVTALASLPVFGASQ
jgi:hypothetical protein